jgi:hypothetical protein
LEKLKGEDREETKIWNLHGGRGGHRGHRERPKRFKSQRLKSGKKKVEKGRRDEDSRSVQSAPFGCAQGKRDEGGEVESRKSKVQSEQ